MAFSYQIDFRLIQLRSTRQPVKVTLRMRMSRMQNAGQSLPRFRSRPLRILKNMRNFLSTARVSEMTHISRGCRD